MGSVTITPEDQMKPDWSVWEEGECVLDGVTRDAAETTAKVLNASHPAFGRRWCRATMSDGKERLLLDEAGLARKLFESDERAIGSASIKGEHRDFQTTLNVAWERNEGGWRTEAETIARRVFGR
jgi:hypothetical protein